MAIDYYLQMSSSVPLRTIDGVPNSIWTYTLTWLDTSLRRIPTDPGPRLALTFSLRVDIRDPKGLPDVPSIQDTQLEKPKTGDVQYVYRDIQGRVGDTIVFCFVAPSALDTFTPIRLAQQSPLTAPWTELPFKVSPQGAPALLQVMPGPAIVCAPAVLPPPKPSTVLAHSTRTIQKATIGSILAPPQYGIAGAYQGGDAITKFRFARQLLLQPGEVNAVREQLASQPDTANDAVSGPSLTDSMWDILACFELNPPRGSSPPALSVLSEVPLSALSAFGNTIAALRKQAVELVRKPVSKQQMPGKESADNQKTIQTVSQTDLRVLTALSRAAAVANKGLALNTTDRGILPIGYLNLERLEMAPAGIVRGELIATIPLAPLEETAVVQKEWSVTSKEFTSIVTDSLENYSETGVTDNTELAQSTTSQNQHSNQFNITGTASGGIEHIFNASASSGFTAQDSSSDSATASAKHSTALTQKASSRVKKEHKVTITTTTVTGTSESTTRTLKNADPLNPIRIDYFRMMREWRVRLYRYGLRLTYDLVIPEPGGALRQAYAYLEWLKNQIGPFIFSIPYSEITVDTWVSQGETEPHYLALAQRYGAQVPPPPVEPPLPAPGPVITKTETPPAGPGWHFFQMALEVPPGFWITRVFLHAHIGDMKGFANPNFGIEEIGYEDPNVGRGKFTLDLTSMFPDFLMHATGKQTVTFFFHNAGPVSVGIELHTEPTPAAWRQWRQDVWSALYNAAQTQYYANQQDIAGKIAQLEARIANVDTLTLRREESEEIMKMAVASIVGDYVGKYWLDVEKIIGKANRPPWPPIPNPIDPFGAGLSLDPNGPGPSAFGASFTRVSDPHIYSSLPSVENAEILTRFINQAIEWENVVTFLYSYFWDTPDSWDFIRNLQHPDSMRQAFLRAGSARVVLTVRKGWENMWTTFINTGVPYAPAKEGDPIPYLSIAQEIAAYDDHNYPGIPPANPNQSAARLEEAVYTTSKDVLSPSNVPFEITVESSVGFVVGAPVVIDSGVGESYPPGTIGKQEQTTITAIRDTDTTHITLAQIQNPHGNTAGLAYAIVQPGEKGVLIAEWNEYTPTSGTDIAVTSNLATIA